MTVTHDEARRLREVIRFLRWHEKPTREIVSSLLAEIEDTANDLGALIVENEDFMEIFQTQEQELWKLRKDNRQLRLKLKIMDQKYD